jgi:peptidyl-prolyl cis-trans isomerase B (cyclophilin B)
VTPGLWQGGAVNKWIPLLMLALPAALLPACSSSVPAAPVTSAAAGASCTYTAAGEAAKKVALPPGTGVPNTGTTTRTMQLNDQKVVLTLDQQNTPCTVNSFVSLASQGFYDNTSCHRLVDGSGLYVLQCGDPSGTGSGGPGYQFADELSGKETYPAGTLAMANAGAGTNGSQFFIVYADSQLSPNYTVFGHTDAAGIKVVADIAKGGQDNSFGASGGGKPNLPAVITTITGG